MAGLALIAVSLAGGTTTATRPAVAGLGAWLVVSLAAAATVFFARAGLAAGTLYAAGDVATKGAVFGGAWLVLVPVLLAAHGLAFVALQLGFQRADALETAGTASRADERAADRGRRRALPRAPAGWRCPACCASSGFVLVIVAAGLLARRRELIPVPA